MARDENKNATEPPMSRPMKMVGLATLIWVCSMLKSLDTGNVQTELRHDRLDERADSDTDAITAKPIATPLVMALVGVAHGVEASPSALSASPVNSPDISRPHGIVRYGPEAVLRNRPFRLWRAFRSPSTRSSTR